jgi:site-specific DNA recombinase
MRAAIYARVSKEEQLEGYSIDAQLDACRKLCRERGWTIADEAVEPGESGKTFVQRPRWQAFMQAARAGHYDVLVCHKIDRFSRSTILDSLRTLEDLKAINVTFVSASEPIDFTTPYGELMLLLMLWFARQYLTNLSAEVTKGRKGRAESGRSNANRPPFGYFRNDDGDDMPNPDTRDLAAAAFERYASECHNDTQIARWLNDQGARTLDGNLFTGDAVRELLINPFYAGWVRYRGIREALTNNRTKRAETKLIRGTHEPVVSQALFDRVQAVRTAVAGKRRGRQPKHHRVYLLQGIAICAHCGERMKCSCSHDGKLRYSCRAGERMIDCEASGRIVREEVLLPTIERVIASLRIPGEVINRAAELLQTDTQTNATQRRRSEIVAEMKRLDYLFQKGRKTQDAYDRETARLEAELALLEPVTPMRIEEVGAALAELVDAWRAARDDRSAQHDILKALVASVEVDALAGRIIKWQPRQDFAALFGRVT